MKSYCLIFLSVIFLTCIAFADEPQPHAFVPAQGFVPDAQTAIRIAEAVWLPIYGEKVLEKKPFHAELKGNRWIVEGTIPSNQRFGGVPIAEISKADGTILRVSHGK